MTAGRLFAATAMIQLLVSGAATARDAVAAMRLEPEPRDAIEALRKSGLVQSPAGVVTLQCATSAETVLENCRILSEAPERAGLGQAALVLAPNYRASAPGPVQVTVSFKAFEAMRWTRKPSNSDLPKAMKAAKIKDTEGRGIVECQAGVEGVLLDCRVLSSIPDPRFGEAAMWLMPHFGLRPSYYDGRPVQTRIVIPLTFRWG